MKQLERMIKEELLKTNQGVCLSLFIPPGPPSQNKHDLNDLIIEASDYLKKTFSASETEEFLRPVNALSKRELEQFDGSIAIFRSKHDFRCLNVPIEVEKECVVSNHYNVKPLLQWLQDEHSFICVDFSEGNVDILQGDAESFASLGCFGLRPSDAAEIDACLENKSAEGNATVVFVSGDRKLAQRFLNASRWRNLDPSIVEKSAYGGDYTRLWDTLNDRMRHRAMRKVKRSLMDYNLALINGHAFDDINEIIKAAKNKKIRKLIISQEDRIWGRFDAYKNQVNRINKQINYEDDDLLDSISESVISNGGEVVLASKKQLPHGKTCLAILKEAV